VNSVVNQVCVMMHDCILIIKGRLLSGQT